MIQAEELVYFIQAGRGEIKIGRSINVARRFANLQGGCPVTLRLWAVTPAWNISLPIPSVELAYHKRFDALRLHGEWFRSGHQIWWEIFRLRGDSPTAARVMPSGDYKNFTPLSPSDFRIDQHGQCWPLVDNKQAA